jgi:CRISPR-associated endonuclease/helicase Cas3
MNPSEQQAYAHSANNDGVRHLLVDHLQAVAEMAAQFAAPLQATELGRSLGLWHDLGKFHPEFQRYLLDAEAGRRRRGPDHKAAGARVAEAHNLVPLMLPLRGHHGGLRTRADLRLWYGERLPPTEEALSPARAALSFEPAAPLAFPPFIRTDRSGEFFLRLLFSALVDADFLDTEAHFSPEQGDRRGSTLTMAQLWDRFATDQRRFDQAAETTVNISRRAIYEACLTAAAQPPGLFRLTVPTGGGKTRSGMAFALRHARQHGQQRIIVAVPYLTITQQTAAEYRRIFTTDDEDDLIVLEHHSGITDQQPDTDEYDPRAIRQRLGAENWDAPIIVTTTVQLFESLFANSTSRCRKLHRLANSVIILDEAQSLPIHLLDPILDGLRELTSHYHTTVVLSTATQPAFDALPALAGLETREIVPEPARHFRALQRVAYDWRIDEPLAWPDIAALMRVERQALAICNTKQDALNLLAALADPEALHLSTLLCGRHRLAVIEEVRRRLEEGLPCRLVATQVVEAGVDIDFPLVLRALAPLDSIIQAAGRANREGKLPSGRVIIFNPVEGGLPLGAYRRATQTTVTTLNAGPVDLHDPDAVRRYFERYYGLEDTDRQGIQQLRKAWDFPEVSRRFRLIDSDTVSVVITGYGAAEDRARVRAILSALAAGAPPTRARLRQLQPFTVSLWQHQADAYRQRGLLSPVVAGDPAAGLWAWLGDYDDIRGLVVPVGNADRTVI